MINIDDIEVGMVVTVIKGAVYKHHNNGIFNLFEMANNNTATTETVTEDSSYKGDVLRVEAIALPYVCLSILKYPKTYGTFELDLREWKLMELPQDYIDAMLRK